MKAILRDIRKGWLPASEIPGFCLFLLGRAFWPLMAVIALGLLVLTAVK